MTSYNLRGTATGTETVYAYTRRRWNELRDNFKAGKRPGVTNDSDGAYAASKLVFVELQNNPGLVTDSLPPDATYLESVINNPANPLTWIAQKTGQAAASATHTAAVNLDKPAQFLSNVGDALPWYVKPGAMVGILAALVILPPLFGKSLEGMVRGLKGKATRKAASWKGFR